jgi:hypothetical protein
MEAALHERGSCLAAKPEQPVPEEPPKPDLTLAERFDALFN